MIAPIMMTLRTTLILLLTLAAAGADTADFKPFTSKEGKFTINFPGKPEPTTSTIKSPLGDMELHTFKVAGGKDKQLYTLSYFDFPTEVIKATDADKLLDSARDGAIENSHGTKTKETKIAKSEKSPPGRDLEVEIQGVTTYSRMLLAGNRLYVITVFPDGGKPSPERAKAFFDSFKLAKDETK